MSTRRFARYLAGLIPSSCYVTRGKKNTFGLIDYARGAGLGRIAIVGEMRGNPSKIDFIVVKRNDWDWISKSILLRGIVFEKAKHAFDAIHVTGTNKSDVLELFDVDDSSDAELVLDASAECFVFTDLTVSKELLRMKTKIIAEKNKR